jgi:monofunctional biosynthetic peptidoglycan transglycosylase
MNQAARLAIMLPSPRTRSPNDLTFYLRQRVIWVERQMQQLGSDYLTPLLD